MRFSAVEVFGHDSVSADDSKLFGKHSGERDMKRKGIILVSVLAAIAFLVFYYFYWGSTVPNGQQPLVRLNSANVATLKDVFNGSANSVRLVVMLSPT
jgi:hypothetical protein